MEHGGGEAMLDFLYRRFDHQLRFATAAEFEAALAGARGQRSSK